MNSKLTGSLLMLAGLAAAAWWAWKRGIFSGLLSSAPAPAAADPLNSGPLPALQQVGSNFEEDVTTDVVREFVGLWERQSAGCWRLVNTLPGTATKVWRNSISGVEQLIEDGRRPVNECGFEVPLP